MYKRKSYRAWSVPRNGGTGRKEIAAYKKEHNMLMTKTGKAMLMLKGLSWGNDKRLKAMCQRHEYQPYQRKMGYKIIPPAINMPEEMYTNQVQGDS